MPCPDSFPFQVVIWQALPCLATHPMFPQLDKAATQPQLWQEWFLVSLEFSNGAHMFEQHTCSGRPLHNWFCYSFAAIKVFFHIKNIRCL